jgi:predicted RND superfamily exporter protein
LSKFVFIFVLAVAGLASLIYSHDIQQKNPETIFLTEKTLAEYEKFKIDILEKHSLVIKKLTTNKAEFYQEILKLEEMCIDNCEIISQKKLSKNSNVKASSDKLMNLETNDYVSIIVLDNDDTVHKKILTYAETSTYWNNDQTSFAGVSYTNFLLDKYSLSIQEKLFPTMFALGFILSLIFVGNLKNALIVYLPCLFSAGFSLATLKFVNGQMNMVSSIVPLVVFTVALSLSFHLYFSLVELKNIIRVIKIKWAPIFLMMFTTYIGFFSLGWAEISVIREFGILSSNLVLFSTFYIFGWYFLWENHLSFPKEENVTKSKFNIFPDKLFNHSMNYWMIILVTIIGVASALIVPKHLDIITDATLYFPKDKKIREKIIAVTNSVSGMPIMEVVIDLGHKLNYVDVQKVSILENDLQQLEFSQKYKLISNNTLVEKANWEYSGLEKIPNDLSGYFLLRGQLPFSLQESYPLESKYRITVLGNPINGKEYKKDLKVISDFLISRNIKFVINGIHHNLTVSQDSMLDVLVYSFLSSALVIFLFSAFFLKSLKLNCIFIFVTLLPVALTFGFMDLMGFSINIATVMTFSISLGLVGDSSFHIIYANKNPFKDFDEYKRAVLFPVIGSGLLLCTCFGMFTFNTFMPIRQFGGILAMIMFFGAIVDLYILPTLIYKTSNHRKAYENLASKNI